MSRNAIFRENIEAMKKILAIALLIAVSASVYAETRIVSHRGGRNEIEENTLPGFKSALEAGITGYELDVHVTADGKYVIMHDSKIERMTGREGVIEEMKYADLRAIKTRDGNLIPSLEEVVALFNKYPGIYVEFEMKTKDRKYYTPDVLARYLDDVHAIINKSKPASSLYLMTTFDVRTLFLLKERHPEQEVMLIANDGLSQRVIADAKAIGTKRIAVSGKKVTVSEVEKAHKDGFILNLWPAKDVKSAIMLWMMGADYVCCDVPRELAKTIDAYNIPFRK